VSLNADDKLFLTVGAEMRKARAAVAVLVDETVSRTEFNDSESELVDANQ